MDSKIERGEPNYYELNKRIRSAEQNIGKRMSIQTKAQGGGELSGIIEEADSSHGEVKLNIGKDAKGNKLHAHVFSTERQGDAGGRKIAGRFVYVEINSVAPDGTVTTLETKDSEDMTNVTIE